MAGLGQIMATFIATEVRSEHCQGDQALVDLLVVDGGKRTNGSTEAEQITLPKCGERRTEISKGVTG